MHVLIAAVQLAFTPYHANGTYAIRERIGWHVSVVPGQSAAGTYTYTVKRDGLSVIGTGTLDLTTGAATIETSLARPGMVLVEVRPPAGTPETSFHGEPVVNWLSARMPNQHCLMNAVSVSADHSFPGVVRM